VIGLKIAILLEGVSQAFWHKYAFSLLGVVADLFLTRSAFLIGLIEDAVV
jgi:hypothetical protein